MITLTVQEYCCEIRNDDIDNSHQLEFWLETTDNKKYIERATVMVDIME